MSAEILTIASLHSAALDATTSRTDGQGLKSTDVAMLLAQLESEQSAMLQYVVLRENTFHAYLCSLLLQKVKNLQVIKKVKQQTRVQTLCSIAMNRLFNPLVCKKCTGENSFDCPKCKGRSLEKKSNLAAMFGVSDQSWGKHWHRRYDVVMMEAERMYADAVDAVMLAKKRHL